ncbi:MAG: amidase [Halieaceae bacterium]|jgi:amidase
MMCHCDFLIAITIQKELVLSELNYMSATDLMISLDQQKLSSEALMHSVYARIEHCNPQVNAICTLIDKEQALSLARQADAHRNNGKMCGPLHGLPMAIKDLSATKGIRTTMGSKVFEHHVPDEDSLLVQRLKKAGVLIIGKTNTPEFGTGSHTFNNVFGTTLNPWNLKKTAGGSSGGAAAVLASGMLPLADGSDMGGSLRNPAAFCGVVGLRPSMGRVPIWPNTMAWQSRLGIEGPMARNVSDCALLLSTMAGPDERDPLSIQEPGELFQRSLVRDFTGTKIGWSPDLGHLPVAKEIISVCESSLPHWRACGFEVTQDCPDVEGAMHAFKILRASCYANFGKSLLASHPGVMKNTVVENIETGLALTGADFIEADTLRTRLYKNVLEFFAEHEFLVLPCTQVAPFDIETEWVAEIGGQQLDSYLDWMSICCIITLFGLPAISIPCGFTADGLPVGLQIVGRPRADFSVLQAAFALEQAMGYGQQQPPL